MRFRILATLAVLLLSAPSALGVQRALAPTRGDAAGWLAAVGIELAYLSLAFAAFADAHRQRLAVRVARAAVLTAITLNVIADYAARVPDGLSGAAQFLASFDWLLLALSVLESAPLAALAYTIATLLHSSAQSHTAHTVPQADTHTAHTDTSRSHTVPQADTQSYQCPHCGAALERQQQYAAARRYGYCARCKQHQQQC